MDDKPVGTVIYHCVSQLREDSWVYRTKREGEPLNEDDLISVDDFLSMHDRLVTERDTLDKKRVNEISDLALKLRTRITELETERATFYMDYRVQCDEQTKAQAVRIQELEREIATLKNERDVARTWVPSNLGSPDHNR